MGDWKTRLSILWLIHVIGGVYNVVLELFRDGNFNKIEGFLVNDYSLLMVSVAWLGPLLMAFFSQILADKANRWANIVVGAVYAIVIAVNFIMSLALDPSVLVINPLFGIIWSVLIVWYAWKSE